MFVKLAIIFVTFLQLSNGLPLETKQPEYDVRSFFSSRIVGGVDVPYGHGKHMVVLIIGYYMRMPVCGGSIITRRHVLSAAHCIEPFVHWGELSSSFTGMIGTLYWNSPKTEIRFSGYVIHPHWDWNTIKNDIGILKTAKAIVYNELVGPMALSFEYKGGGLLATVIGWGRVEHATPTTQQFAQAQHHTTQILQITLNVRFTPTPEHLQEMLTRQCTIVKVANTQSKLVDNEDFSSLCSHSLEQLSLRSEYWNLEVASRHFVQNLKFSKPAVWGDVPCRAQWLNVSTLSPQQCSMHMKYIEQDMGKGPPLDPRVEICTFHSFGHGMCNGDSGCPLTCAKTGQQIGIVSWGYPCAKGAPDVHARLSAFKVWILKQISGHYNV